MQASARKGIENIDHLCFRIISSITIIKFGNVNSVLVHRHFSMIQISCDASDQVPQG